MKILVTGGSGYIGRHVVRRLLKEGHEVFVADYQFKGVDERAHFIEEPIFSGEKDIYRILGRPDLLIHLAWRDGFIHNSDAHMGDLSNHIIFLRNMIDGGLKNLSVMGSMHEVGYWEGEINEDTPCNPMSQYGVAKNALRQSLMLYAEKKDVCLHWLRAFYIYGDDLWGSSIFSKLCMAEEEGNTKFPFTSGKNKYDFIHIDELADMIVKASVQTQIDGIINVCTGKPVSLGEKVENFIREHGFKIQLEYGAFPDRKYDSPIVWGNTEKIDLIMRQCDSGREEEI